LTWIAHRKIRGRAVAYEQNETAKTEVTIETVEIDMVRMKSCEIVENVLRNNYRKKGFIQYQCCRPLGTACY